MIRGYGAEACARAGRSSSPSRGPPGGGPQQQADRQRTCPPAAAPWPDARPSQCAPSGTAPAASVTCHLMDFANRQDHNLRSAAHAPLQCCRNLPPSRQAGAKAARVNWLKCTGLNGLQCHPSRVCVLHKVYEQQHQDAFTCRAPAHFWQLLQAICTIAIRMCSSCQACMRAHAQDHSIEGGGRRVEAPQIGA